jgi:hypothetical protein
VHSFFLQTRHVLFDISTADKADSRLIICKNVLCKEHALMLKVVRNLKKKVNNLPRMKDIRPFTGQHNFK